MPHKVCLEPRCPNVAAPQGRGRCLAHYRERERERNRRRREVRGGRIYDTKKWTVARKRALFEKPICELAGTRWQKTSITASLCRRAATRTRRRTCGRSAAPCHIQRHRVQESA